jgi:hypothetical protein
MDKNNNTLGGFETILDGIMPTDPTKEPTKFGFDEGADELSDDEIEALKGKRAPSVNAIKGIKDDKKKQVDNEDDDDEEDDEVKSKVEVTKKAKAKKVEEPEETEEDDDDIEEEDDDAEVEDIQSEAIESLFDAISEEIGWEFDENDPEDVKPKTVTELVKYFKDVITESSVPEYSSEDVQKLDEFVRNGGKLEDYFQAGNGIDYETIDITDENNQKKVITALYKEKGWDAARITKKLERYEDAGVLEDEAEEAVELLKKIESEKKEALLEGQKKTAEEAKQKQQKFYSDVVNEIKGLSDIRGIKISKDDRARLAEYIFKYDSNGVTQYQKDYAKSVKNLLESAYFTMKGDALISAAKSEGNSTAMQRLKNSLKTTGSRKSSKRVTASADGSIWSNLAQQLKKE